MPIVNIKLNIEHDLENGSYKHYLNHVDFEVFSAKEDETLFSLVKKNGKKVSVSRSNSANDSAANAA